MTRPEHIDFAAEVRCHPENENLWMATARADCVEVGIGLIQADGHSEGASPDVAAMRAVKDACTNLLKKYHKCEAEAK